MAVSLKQKTVLFIAPKFYDYHKKIIDALEELSFEVFFFENKFFREDPMLNDNDFISWVKRRKHPNYKTDYQKQILTKIKDRTIDLFLCIGGFSITSGFVDELKSMYPQMRCIAYFWDSFRIWDYRNLISSFNRVYTFDRSDARKYQLEYLPLFYYFGNTEHIPYQDRTIDFLFVGSVGYYSLNRLSILKYFEQLSSKQKLNSLLWLYFPKASGSIVKRGVNWLRRRSPGRYRGLLKLVGDYEKTCSFIKHEVIDSDTLPQLIRQAKCIIDIPVPGQIGLTMRTIETLASGAKLITTNQSIVEEPFYTPEFIRLIDEKQPAVDINFLQSDVNTKIDIEYLQLRRWLTKLLDI
ncbi:hypothetical protein RYH73_06180 [Olivibacter sp. CPCC 100613]|uniref:hypothetical protein n=1 Tax=Olivibacter sp. CPCC 100613 TaxID=3079931 RepID=UPI002FF5DAC5